MPKAYRYATLDSVIEGLNQGAVIRAEEVRPSLVGAVVHVGFYGMGGGYLPDSETHYYARNRRAVVDAHCETCRDFDEMDRAPSGFRANLMRGGSAYTRDGRTCFEVDVMRVSDLIAP